jgi:anti-sigma B factor antagonist
MPDPSSFQIEPEDVGPRVRILTVQGEADRFGTDAVSSAVDDARADGRGVIIDLSEATYLDSSMLATLVAVSEQGRRDNSPLVILCGAARLRRSLELKGLQSILSLANSREHALELVTASDGRPGGPASGPA